MNKFILPFIVILLFQVTGLFAQEPACVPDSSYANDLAGVYPGPYHEELFPDGGIEDIACINQEFEVVLTAVIRETISYGGFEVKLNHLSILENGFVGLPEGLEYACNPPNCFFESNTLGCMRISGIPAASNEPGDYDLKLVAEIEAADGLIVIQDTLPQFLIPGSHYYLHVEEETSPNCVSNTTDNGPKEAFFEIWQNPVRDALDIKLSIRAGIPWSLDIMNLQGQKLLQKKGQGARDHLRVELNSGLSPGYYFVRLASEGALMTKKFVILAN